MVALSFFLRVLLPFDIHAGWKRFEAYLSSPASCARASIPQPTAPTEYRAPRVKFAQDVAEVSPSSTSSDESNDVPWQRTASEDRRQPTDGLDERPPQNLRRPRRTRSLLACQEAKAYPTKGEPETLFCDTTFSFRDEPSQPQLDVQALKAELYDKEVCTYKRIIDDLTEQLADAQEVLRATEMEVEQVLQKNGKLEKDVKRLTYENAQLYNQAEQCREDLITLHEWIYSVQAPLTQLGIYPTSLNEKLNVKMKVPRAFPTLSPHVSSRLATSSDYFTPPSTPPPSKAPNLKLEKGSLIVRPTVRCDTSFDWDDDSLRAFASSSPTACSSPVPSRPSSPLSFTCSSSSSSPKPSRTSSPGPLVCLSPTPSHLRSPSSFD